MFRLALVLLGGSFCNGAIVYSVFLNKRVAGKRQIGCLPGAPGGAIHVRIQSTSWPDGSRVS
jgi:hypothetical protein